MYRSHGAQRFKHTKSAASRKAEAVFIRAKYPQKIPVIVERYPGELYLPFLDKAKFLVPQEMSMCQFVTIIRERLALSSSQTFYLLVKNRSLVNMCATMCELDQDYKDSDGFLYMTYASQEMFGSCWARFVSVPGKIKRWEPCGCINPTDTIADLVLRCPVHFNPSTIFPKCWLARSFEGKLVYPQWTEELHCFHEQCDY